MEELECSICLECIDEELADHIKVPCCHKIFHKNCLTNCLINKTTCPLCRCQLDLQIKNDKVIINKRDLELDNDEDTNNNIIDLRRFYIYKFFFISFSLGYSIFIISNFFYK